MEPKYQHTVNGQSVLQADFNAMGDASGLADDRVFAELFRMAPYDGSTISRGILPFLYTNSGEGGLIQPAGASGSVQVHPFRAFIGSRTAVASSGKDNWRDIRSAIAVGSTTLHQTVALTANASGDPRWDLIYAAVAVDANSATVTRKVKNPTTKVIADQSLVTTIVSTVTVGVVTGTTDPAPDWPSLPADAAGTYYIVLGYVRVPDGFGAASTVLETDIATAAPLLLMSEATGGASLEFADTHRTIGGGTLTAAQIQTWGSSGTKPKMWVPSTAAGSRSLIAAVDLTTGSESHVTGAVIDSRDWRGRICKWVASVSSTGTSDLAWDEQGPRTVFTPNASVDTQKVATVTGNAIAQGMGQTLRQSGAVDPVVARIDSTNHTSRVAATVEVYCDMSTGKLKVSYAGNPNAQIVFWFEFSGRIENT